MIRRIATLLFVASIAILLFYVSRFWDFRLWGNEGLFGIRWLRPQGGLLQVWLRNTAFAPYELIIWAVGSILILTGVERLLAWVSKRGK